MTLHFEDGRAKAFIQHTVAHSKDEAAHQGGILLQRQLDAVLTILLADELLQLLL